MLDPVDALDDGLKRFGDQLFGIPGLQAIGLHMDIDHRDGDLRFFLARERDQRDDPEDEGRHQEQWRQR